MGESPGTPESVRPPEDRLDSWKEVAAYLKRDVTTVQRWEKREGMPVHRHLHDRLGSVFASRTELDAWARSRKLSGAGAAGEGDEVPPGASARAGSAAPSTAPRRARIALWLAAAAAACAVGAGFWLRETEPFWRSPIADARLQTLTDFDASTEAAAVSRDGHFVAFLSDRDGPTDVWVTQVGSGQFHNLTGGTAPELVNPSVRVLGFSPDGALVTFWVRRPAGPGGAIGIWAVPTLGGVPAPYLEGVAEYDWSRDGTRLAYHTPAPGDPLFVSESRSRVQARHVFTAPAGMHSHFPTWAPDGTSLYFVLGSLPDKLDIWRIGTDGGTPVRVTSQSGLVSHPVFLDRRTLMYLASDPDGSGPWLYSMDVKRRIPHRLTSGPDRYTSLAASADGYRLVATIARPKSTLWRLRVADGPAEAPAPARVPLTTGTGSSPRLGADGIVYVAAAGTGQSIWRFADGSGVELWSGRGAQILGGPALSRDGRKVAFSVRRAGKTLLCVMGIDGTNVRIVSDTLDLQGAPAWAPDGRSLAVAADDHGVPRVYRVPVGGAPLALLAPEYSLDPVWSPDGRFVVYSGPDIGTTFSVKAVTAAAGPHPLPQLTLTRGSRRLAFTLGGRALVYLRGEISHKDLWLLDLETGAERPLMRFAPNFDVRDFDISADGRDVVVERVQERSDVLLMDLARS